MSGNVFIETNRIEKPGIQVNPESNVVLKNKIDNTWVSRAGYKLDGAMNFFSKHCHLNPN